VRRLRTAMLQERKRRDHFVIMAHGLMSFGRNYGAALP
jgi:hypothetical protein